jgi:hypothetical protein
MLTAASARSFTAPCVALTTPHTGAKMSSEAESCKGKGSAMRTEKSYINEYGKKAGPIIFKLLQKEAAHARWKDYYRKKLKQCREQVARLEK